MKRFSMPLQPIIVEPQWGIDVVEPINPKSSKGHMYILMATYCFMKWTEAVEINKVDSQDLIKFLKDNILLRFGV
jgi:hypothetical protein